MSNKTKTNYVLSIDEKFINLFNHAIDSKDYGWVVADIFGGELLKLSKENCDEIFGVVDVEKLAEKEYREFPTNPKDKSEWKYNRDNNYHLKRKAYIKGFNKAMELNKDKVFTLENILDAWELGASEGPPLTRSKKEELLKSLQQPTEINVDIVMECKIGCVNFIFNGENSLCCGDKVPRLDSNDCLILKRIK